MIVVSYGITSRVAQRAIEMARDKGLRVGKLRLIAVWPFPDAKIRELAARAKAFVVPELNMGQMVGEVERAAGGAGEDYRRAARRRHGSPPGGDSRGDRGGRAMTRR